LTGSAFNAQTSSTCGAWHSPSAALTGGESGKLRQWIEGARRCEFGAVARFAYGLKKDLAAVTAAVESSWSTGQVEGQINRLKTIKRQMYGRAVA
jgi:transposase